MEALAVVGRACLTFAVAYGLFVACWLWLHIDAFAFALHTKDNKWNSLGKVSEAQIGDDPQTRTLIFVRHGESTWNVTFNRSKNPIFFIPRLLHAALVEIKLIITGVQDSWFIDSPLCEYGLTQAEEMAQFFRDHKEDPKIRDDIKVILGEQGSSTLVTSNLRRAISTGVVGVWDRLENKTKPSKMYVHSALQEVSRNPDTMSITPASTLPVPSWVDCEHKRDLEGAYAKHLEASNHSGNKSSRSNGLDRMLEFNEWAFSADSGAGTLICFGHSLWFRSYFKEFLHSNHICKTKKMKNCAAVKLQVRRVMLQGQAVYSIAPNSVEVIYLGFEGK
jgi:hypothetical protein